MVIGNLLFKRNNNESIVLGSLDNFPIKQQQTKPVLDKTSSFYLDFLRVIAAFGVLLYHANQSWFSNELFLSEKFGNKLVMVFFVLSGYLIAFTVEKKKGGLESYLIDRVSRLYSVVLPALLLTFILDFIGNKFRPEYYAEQITTAHQLIRYTVNATFLSQIWTFCTKPSSNGAFWSISYEFWYYVLFGAYYYLQGKKRYIAVVLICLLVGYKILLLLPVWIFGVIAFRLSGRVQIKPSVGFFIFVSSFLIIIVLTGFWDFSFVTDRFTEVRGPLYFSEHFRFDWIYGAIVAVNLFSIASFAKFVRIPEFINKSFTHLASITFSLYLYHLPMLLIIGALVPYDKSNYLEVILLIMGLIAIVALLSQVTEKQRRFLKAVIISIVGFFHKKTLFARRLY